MRSPCWTSRRRRDRRSPARAASVGGCAPGLRRGRGYSLLESIGKRLIHGEVASTGKRGVERMIPKGLAGLLLELLAPGHQVLGPEQLRTERPPELRSPAEQHGRPFALAPGGRGPGQDGQ